MTSDHEKDSPGRVLRSSPWEWKTYVVALGFSLIGFWNGHLLLGRLRAIQADLRHRGVPAIGESSGKDDLGALYVVGSGRDRIVCTGSESKAAVPGDKRPVLYDSADHDLCRTQEFATQLSNLEVTGSVWAVFLLFPGVELVWRLAWRAAFRWRRG